MSQGSYETWKMEQLEDPQFREELERLEIAYQVARLRVLRGFTQEELARRIGTKQSSISRLESGSREPTTAFLRRIARALDARLEIALVPNDAAGAEHLVEPEQNTAETITLSISAPEGSLLTAPAG